MIINMRCPNPCIHKGNKNAPICCTGDICEWNLILSKAINRKDLPLR